MLSAITAGMPSLRSIQFGAKKEDKEPQSSKKLPTIALFSDIDGTWDDGNVEARAILDQEIIRLKETAPKDGFTLLHGYITGRPPEDIPEKNLPKPNFTIAHNGAFIQKGPGLDRPNAHWISIQRASGFDAPELFKAAKSMAAEKYPNLQLRTIGEIYSAIQPNLGPFAMNVGVSNDSIQLEEGEHPAQLTKEHFKAPKQVERFIQDIEHIATEKGMQFQRTEPYPGHHLPNVLFELAAPTANKGGALEFMMKELDLKPENVIIACDGGNDISMIKPDGRHVIIIGAEPALRKAAAKLDPKNVDIRPLDEPSSLGVLSGLKKYIHAIRNQNEDMDAQKSLKNEKRTLDLSA